jgi:hypothetical protein
LYIPLFNPSWSVFTLHFVYVSPPSFPVSLFFTCITMVAPLPDEGDTTCATPGAQAYHEKRRMQPLGQKSPSGGDIVASSFDSVLMAVRAPPATSTPADDELLEKQHQCIITKNAKKQQQKQRMVSSSPPMNDIVSTDENSYDENIPSDDDFIDMSITDSDATVASIDVVSSSGSTSGGDGEVSFPGSSCDSSSQGSYTEEEEDDEMVAVATEDHPDHRPTVEVQERQADAAAADVDATSFAALRWSYLIVTLVVMLADGMQGMFAAGVSGSTDQLVVHSCFSH